MFDAPRIEAQGRRHYVTILTRIVADAALFTANEPDDQDKNPECVACHVVGYDAEGGFASMKSSPHLANVQCENCHGPRKDHIDHPTKKGDLVDAKKVCVECHQGNHSPNFEYKKYWDLIKHDSK
jgi:hypothetical protein